ncbi:MAG: DUF1697 domain-containing protein [Actinomycetota bacterium]|nr:DUF1697 domain-containing protein [Actinomycetota bacterium]
MTTYVALLRGINVGGKNKIAMPELRSLFEGLGHKNVATYVQSGNIIFQSRSSAPKKVAGGIERAISENFDLSVSVILRTRTELKRVAAENPFLNPGVDFASLHIMFLADAPARKAIENLDPDRSPPDEFEVRGREIYLRFPNGAGRSKLTIDYFERKLGTSATARNWNTVTKLLKLMEERR